MRISYHGDHVDNHYFIGYRIDVPCQDDAFPDSDVFDEEELLGDDVYMLPHKPWMTWSSTDSNVKFSVMAMKVLGIPEGDYRCPIDRAELWEDLHKRPYDAPDDMFDVFARLMATHIGKRVLERYPNAKPRWGIFLGLG